MTVAALTGMIPIVVAGGLVLKFTEAGMPVVDRKRRKRRTQRYYSKRRSTSSHSNFGNVGF